MGTTPEETQMNYDAHNSEPSTHEKFEETFNVIAAMHERNQQQFRDLMEGLDILHERLSLLEADARPKPPINDGPQEFESI